MFFRAEGFTGINNVDKDRKACKVQAVDEGTLALSGDLLTALNFHLPKDRAPRGLKYPTDKATGTAYSSLFANRSQSICLAVDGTTLKLYDSAYAAADIKTGLAPNRRMRFVEHNGIIFMGNGQDMLMYDQYGLSDWGVSRPLAGMIATAGSAGMAYEGTVLYGVTYVCQDGHESGMSPLVSIALTADQSVTLSGIPVSASAKVTSKRIYRTAANGDPGKALFLIAEIPTATTTHWDNVNDASLSVENTTWDYIQPPGSNIIGEHFGRVYACSGRYCFYSEPLLPQAFRQRNHFPVGDDITAWSHDGSAIYIHTFTDTWPIVGRDPEEATLLDPVPIGAVKQNVLAPNGYPVFMTPHGGWAACSGGKVEYLDRDNYRLSLGATAEVIQGYDIDNNELIGVVIE